MTTLDLQRALQARGFYHGRIDGVAGPMTKAAVIAFQRAEGLVADGVAGPITLARLKGADAKPGARGLIRIIWHWTAGTNAISVMDRAHYHFIIAGDGTVAAGNLVPEDNISTADRVYAGHALNANTGAIGIGMAGMHGARESPFDAGGFPINDIQVNNLILLTVTLSRKYGVAVDSRYTLSHAEIQPTLGIPQKGKWDIAWLPGMARPGDPVAIGNILRGRVLAAMKAVS